MTFRLITTDPQNFFCLNINFCKRLQTLITNIIPFQNLTRIHLSVKFFIFDLSFFFPHTWTKILCVYFKTTALSCKPFLIQPNSNTDAPHRHFFKTAVLWSIRAFFLVSPILYQYPRTQLHILSFLILHALHQAVLFDAYW